MNLVRLAAITALTALTACAASYTPPVSGPTARLRVTVAEAGRQAATSVNQYRTGRCESPVSLGYFGGSLNMTDFKPIGMPGAKFRPANQYLERTIEAESRQLLSVRTLYQNKSCFVSASFVPSSGGDYEMTVDWNDAGCRVRIHRILGETDDHLRTAPESTAKQEETCRSGFN